MSSARPHVLAVILAFVLSTVWGCGGSSRYLVVTHITHFAVQGNGERLDFPVYAETMSIETIQRDLDFAEYYHDKLAALYNFKSFTLVQSGISEMFLPEHGPVRLEDPIYSYEDDHAKINLSPIEFGADEAKYELSISDGAGAGERVHVVSVPNRQSASVGLLYDAERNRGYLIVITLHVMEITRSTTPQEFAEFLKEKNTVGAARNRRDFDEDDQWWMNELFGEDAITLPVAEQKPEEGTKEESIEFDTPPSPIGGMIALQQAAVYPPKAKAEGREGRVLVKVGIDTTGTVTEYKIVSSAGADFDSSAAFAVRSVRFTPAMKDGMPVAVWVVVPVQYKLK